MSLRPPPDSLPLRFAQTPLGGNTEQNPPENTRQNTRPKAQLTPEMEARKWQPGQSGNAGGRPKKTPIDDVLVELLSQKHPGDKMERSHAEILATKLLQLAEKGNLRAISEVIDRTEGRSVSCTELSGHDGAPLFMEPATRAELERRVAALLAGHGPESSEPEKTE